MQKIQYQTFWFDTDHTIGDKGQFPGGDQRRVQVNGTTVGFLRVIKEGWAQSNKKRGTPSQIWKFEPVRSSYIGVQIARNMPTYTEYFSDAKKVISTVVNGVAS
jgi:hypothetical protein